MDKIRAFTHNLLGQKWEDEMRLLLILIFAFLILMALLPKDESKKEDPVSTPEVVEELPKIKHKKPIILDAKVLVKKEGFFVALKVDAYELAKLNFRYTCNHPGFFSADTQIISCAYINILLYSFIYLL